MHLHEERVTKVEEQGLEAALNTIRLHSNDAVVIARHHVLEGTPVPWRGLDGA
ncbi:MAG TPA: hypothetical protein VFC19_46595 [Candidatus Limnocylindrales bacterium]|nr:hypothetical protein [Candidatus Limnocylindrales bacterium]